MPGLGRRLIGAALRGAGTGMVHAAEQTRKETLLKLRREWQKEDTAASQAMTREGLDRADTRQQAGFKHAESMAGAAREHSAGMTREGWDRADTRCG